MAESRPEETQQHSNQAGERPAGDAQINKREPEKNDLTPDETELRSPARPSRKRFIIIGAVVLVLIAVGLYWWHSTYY
mgnify:FL=1